MKGDVPTAGYQIFLIFLDIPFEINYGIIMGEVATIYPIGIDMDDRYLTAAQFRNTSQGLRLRGVFCRPLEAPPNLDAGDTAWLVAALRGVASCGLFKGSRVAFNIPFQDLSVFPVHFQLGEQDNPEEAILQEAVKFLPFPIEEAVIDYPSFVRLADGTCDATVVAVRRQVMNRWLMILRRAGFTAEVMDFSISSLIRLHRTFFGKTDQADLICHIGRHKSLIAVAAEERIISISEIYWGIQSLCEKIQVHLELLVGGDEPVNLLKVCGLAYDERESLQETMQSGSGDAAGDMDIYRVLFQIIAPVVDELVYECHKTVSYVRSIYENASLGAVYLYGLGELISHLDRYMEKQMGIPARSVDYHAHLELDTDTSCISTEVSTAPALGLAMRKVTWL